MFLLFGSCLMFRNAWKHLVDFPIEPVTVGLSRWGCWFVCLPHSRQGWVQCQVLVGLFSSSCCRTSRSTKRVTLYERATLLRNAWGVQTINKQQLEDL